MTEPTPDEARNGWTRETLKSYIAQQTKAQSARLDPENREPQRPSVANGRYSPYRWRS